jgi:hypothetical protein
MRTAFLVVIGIQAGFAVLLTLASPRRAAAPSVDVVVEAA